MDTAETIAKLNHTIQGDLRTQGFRTLTADQAADLVYAAGIMSPEGSPPGTPGFTFRQFLRDIRDGYGHEALYALLGVRQSDNQPGGKYTVYRFDAPSMETIVELLATSTSTRQESLDSSPLCEALP